MKKARETNNMSPPQPPPMPPAQPPQPPHPPPYTVHHPARAEEGTAVPPTNSQPTQPAPQPTNTPVHSTELAFFLNVIHNLTQFFLGAVIISALIVPNIAVLNHPSLQQHIILCTVGYFILMTQAILAFSPAGWANNLKYENKRLIHATMQIIGAVLAISGSAIRIADIGFNMSYSVHSLCGFIAMILTILSLIGGVLNLIFPKRMSTKCMQIFHSCLGTITIVTAFITLIVAFSYYHRNILGDANVKLSIAFTVFALFGTIIMAMCKNIKRLSDK